jgi:hypothetical protein
LTPTLVDFDSDDLAGVAYDKNQPSVRYAKRGQYLLYGY